MTTEPGASIARRAAEASHAATSLFSELRGALVPLGIELTDVRSTGVDGAWMLVCRFAAPGAAEIPAAELPADAGDDVAWMAPRLPDPPFVSPIPSTVPFDGDGTSDLMRFIEEADPAARVPPLGGVGEVPPLLGAADRARLLASTIPGDLVLAVMHEGRADDAEVVREVLAEGWERYTTEVRRLGLDPDAALYAAASERAAAMIAEDV
jgi:hypothetical protein